MKILSWNIQQGGSDKRIPQIAEQLNKHAPDVLIVTEYWEGPKGERLQALLREAGYTYMKTSGGQLKQNSILVASLHSFEVVSSFYKRETNKERWLEIKLDKQNLHVLAVHIPTSNNKPQEKLDFWKEVNTFAREHSNTKSIIIGDYNTGLPEDAQGTPFYGTEYMKELIDLGWTDAWRHTHGSFAGYSWYSPKGNGFRLDHAFVSPTLKDAILETYFSHRERLLGYSDHSVLVMELLDEDNN
ncbi:endonuclease/exonuclease/phosphatase family protein [Bacillus sp. AFS018417]|uniref:endonuclease/exonuclease/phosphatase family protein n=1 Tax=Bacillus sp. AFS018417 TaxID=2033491 RepID=UPI0020D1FBC9|nr:endonuclease/exonuclease/phosphatase family protein [Bacillus sp. AFS018417]